MNSPLLSLALFVQRPFFRGEQTKIWAPLTQDSDGYPPFKNEGLWSIRRGWDLFEVRNVPFFAKGLAWGDIVSASSRNGALYITRIARRSGLGTLRVLVSSGDSGIKNTVEEIFSRASCDWEWNDEQLVAVSVRNESAQRALVADLGSLEDKDVLSYEIGVDAQAHARSEPFTHIPREKGPSGRAQGK